MKFSTEQRRRSRLQGHRKRRRKIRIEASPETPVGWMEYKTMRQYPSMGEMLDQMRQYGYRGAIESMIERGWCAGEESLFDYTVEEFTEKEF